MKKMNLSALTNILAIAWIAVAVFGLLFTKFIDFRNMREQNQVNDIFMEK